MAKDLCVPTLKGGEVPVWSIDFETYYEDSRKGYSLSNPKISTTMYVRDERFKAHGCSVVEPSGKTYWVSHEDLPEFFNSLPRTIAFLGQNCYFDALIASHHYEFVADFYCDTMSLSLAEFGVHVSASLEELCKRLGLEGKLKGELEKTAGVRDLSKEQEAALIPYAIQDAVQTRKAFEIIWFDRGFPERELFLIDLHIRMFADPKLIVNTSLCYEEIEEENIRLANLLNSTVIADGVLSKKCAQKLNSEGLPALFRSRPCFIELLRSRGVEPPTKQKKNKNGEVLEELTWALSKTDIEFQHLANDPRVSDLIDIKTGVSSNIRKNRAEQLLKHTHNGKFRLPVPLKYCGAHTTRSSGFDNINLQNLPSGRGNTSSRLRRSLTAPDGYVICVADSSQIEARMNAWLWGEVDILNQFATGQDPYSEIASALYGVKVDKHGPYGYLRPVGKAMLLGLGYGMGWLRFLDGCLSGSIIGEVVDMDEARAKEAVEFYRSKNFHIVEGWNFLQTALNLMVIGEANLSHGPISIKGTQIVLPSGLSLKYNNIHYRYNDEKKKYELVFKTKVDKRTGDITWIRTWGSSVNENVCQALARIVVMEQALEISRKYPILMQVHDENIFLVKEEEAEEAFAYAQKCMSTPLDWCPDLPLASEGGWDYCYSK